MPRAARVCSRCPAITTNRGMCPACARAADTARGTSSQRGYTSPGHQRFRNAVLERDPICVLCRAAWATVADHYPRSRKQLLADRADPNDPTHGRGLCKPCHDRHTATAQPGGWAAG